MSTKSTVLSAAILCLATMLGGCAAHDRLTGVNNTFLEDVDISAKKENLPFDHSWVAPGAKKSNYDKVLIKRVRTDKLPADSWTSSASAAIPTQKDYTDSVTELAGYFRSQIAEKINQQSGTKFALTNQPDSRTLVVEIAFTEVEFSHPIARAGALAAPIPGTGVALSTISDPHVAFAARVTDGGTGKLVATIADRKFPPTRIVDLNKLTATSSTREVCALWADTLAQALASDGQGEISEERFALLPW